MRNPANALHAVAASIAMAISLAYLVVPIYKTSDGHETAVQSNGSWVIVLLVVPIVLAFAPYLSARDSRRTSRCWAATLLTLFALVTGFTIGTPYLLPALMLWIAWLIEGRRADIRDQSSIVHT